MRLLNDAQKIACHVDNPENKLTIYKRNDMFKNKNYKLRMNGQHSFKGGGMMANPADLDRTFHFIMKRMVESGQAPHYTEIASGLGISVEEGRKALHDLMAAPGIPGWLFPNTDYIASFAPFNNLPTQYRITIEGQQKWFGQ
jgi:hypothetical protein